MSNDYMGEIDARFLASKSKQARQVFKNKLTISFLAMVKERNIPLAIAMLIQAIAERDGIDLGIDIDTGGDAA